MLSLWSIKASHFSCQVWSFENSSHQITKCSFCLYKCCLTSWDSLSCMMAVIFTVLCSVLISYFNAIWLHLIPATTFVFTFGAQGCSGQMLTCCKKVVGSIPSWALLHALPTWSAWRNDWIAPVCVCPAQGKSRDWETLIINQCRLTENDHWTLSSLLVLTNCLPTLSARSPIFLPDSQRFWGFLTQCGVSP